MSSPPSNGYAIESVGLSKRFGHTQAVDDLTLRLPVGTVFGFIGPNGAGKSTTIKILMGLLRRTAGEVHVLGVDPGRHPERVQRRVGYVPELHHIYRWMRVGQVVAFCRALYETWNESLCDELIKQFDLDPRKKVKHLSKGMLAKLALLVAVAHEPELLILDEPMSGLDPLVREEFLDGVLRAICAQQRTVLFSSHTLGDVQRLADRVGIIHDGRLLVDCPTDELVAGTKRIRAVLRDGRSPDRPPEGTIWQRVERREWLLTVRGYTPRVLDELRATGVVESVEVTDLGLEDVFKDFVKGWRRSP